MCADLRERLGRVGLGTPSPYNGDEAATCGGVAVGGLMAVGPRFLVHGQALVGDGWAFEVRRRRI